jgi:hypothetical protein
LSSQQFWAKVTRAAKRMGGQVGVRVAGREWWVWTVKRGQMDGGVVSRKGGRTGRWSKIWDALAMAGGRRVEVRQVLAKEDAERLRLYARAKGMVITVEADSGRGCTWVQEVGEV